MTLIPTQTRLEELGFLRLREVLRLYPVSKSVWWAGVKSGKYPKPVKLSTRVTAWRAIEIEKLLAQVARQECDENLYSGK